MGNPYDDFGDNTPATPTELIPEEHPYRTDLDVVSAEVRMHGTRMAKMQESIDELRSELTRLGMNRLERQWRYFRRYLLNWIRESSAQEPIAALRSFRKFMTVWLKDED